MIMMADEQPLAVHRLRLLSDQPVEGCELVPDVFMLNGISPLSVRLEYKWYRCMDKMACSWCGKTRYPSDGARSKIEARPLRHHRLF